MAQFCEVLCLQAKPKFGGVLEETVLPVSEVQLKPFPLDQNVLEL